MNKIFLVNLPADFISRKLIGKWNNYAVPEILQDFLVGKGFDAQFINLNSLFIESFFSDFDSEFLDVANNKIAFLEGQKKISESELEIYLSLKLMCEIYEKNQGKNILEINKYSLNNIPAFAASIMEPVNVLQKGEVLLNPGDNELQLRIINFRKIINFALKKAGLDLNNSLLIFTVPSKVHYNSLIWSAAEIRKMFPSCKIAAAGPYIKLCDISLLDHLVEKKIIDIYVRDSEEGKLLSLAKAFSYGNIPQGNYIKSEQFSINDFIKKTQTYPKRQKILFSNGCYYGKCAFCEYPLIYETRLVKKINVLMDEIENLNRHGVNNFCLITDCLHPVLAKQIASEILRRRLNIKWDSTFIRIDEGFTESLFLLMKKSGFNFGKVEVGMESSIDFVLKTANKGYTKKIIDIFAANAKNAGVMFSKFNIIYDLPGTDAENINEMKKFILELFDITKSVVGVELYVSKSSEFGMHPEKYGIEILGNDDSEIKDSLKFRIENGFSENEREGIRKFFSFLNKLYFVSVNYPTLSTAVIARTKIYSEKDYKLLVRISGAEHKINSLFDENGDSIKMQFYVPDCSNELSPEELFILKNLSKLEKETWYSLGEIAEIIGYSSELEKIKLLQKLFYSAIAVLSSGGFADARIENIKEG